MPSPFSKSCAVLTLVAGAVALAGCRHTQKTAAAPAVAPPAVQAAAKTPETKVASPAQDFVNPAAPADAISDDPTQATLQAEQKGWIRDAFFDFNSAAIRPDASSNLQTTAQWLRDHRRFQVEVEGHCDERGTEQYNLALG